MASIALTSNGVISDAESVTNWTGDTFSLEPDIKVEGSNSVSCAQTNNGNNDLYYAGSFSLSGTHIRLYWNCTYVGNFDPTNPVQVFLSDGTNTDYVTYFASNSDYGGGWADLIVDTALFTTVNLASITQVGIRVVTASKPRNQPANVYLDNWRYFNGIEITSTTTEAVDLNDAYVLDAASVYGAIKLIDGVFFCPAEILLGSTGSANLNFVSSNETVIFPDRQVTSSLYKLKTQEGTGNTDIDISGMVCKTVGGTGAEIDISSSLNSLSIKNSSFIDMGTVTLTPTVTTPTFDTNTLTNCGTTAISMGASGCSWVLSGQVTKTGSGSLVGCTFDRSTAAVAVSISSLTNLDDCTFISDGTGHAVDLGTISTSTSMDWNCQATGYAGTNGSTGNEILLVNVASGQTLTINSSGTTPTYYNTGSGTVNIVSGAVTVKVTVQNTAGTKIENARVYLTRASDSAVVLNGLTDANGEIADSAYTYSGDDNVSGWARKSSASPFYKEGAIAGTITASGFSGTAILIADE